MRLGVFTPLLSHLPLEDALATLKSLQIDTVELGTGNYPGDAHCKLSMLEDASALKEFQQKLKGPVSPRATIPRACCTSGLPR